MNPILYDFSTNISDYTGHGKGLFTHIESCEVKEVLNGEYTLSLRIYDTDPLAKIISPNMCIKAKPNFQDPEQIFVIRNINLTEQGLLEISADHIKYLFFNNVIISGDVGEKIILDGDIQYNIDTILSDYIVLPNYFNFRTYDFDPNIPYPVEIGSTELTLGEIFDNSDNGLIARSKGEFWYDNFNIKFLKRRGKTKPYNSIRYGSNLSSYGQEISNTNEYTHILPYADVPTTDDYQGEEKTVRLYGRPTSGGLIPTASTSGFNRVLKIDFTNKFNKKGGYVNPSSQGYGYEEAREKLRELGSKYIERHTSISQPAVNIKVDYQPVLKDFEKVALGDSVNVYYDPTGYKGTHRVTETNYDPVNERYNSIVVGDRKYTLYNFIKNLR